MDGAVREFRTPSSNADEVMAGFSRADRVLVENGGHGGDLLLATPELEGWIVDLDPFGAILMAWVDDYEALDPALASES